MTRPEGFVRAVSLRRDAVPSFDEFPFSIPAVRSLETLELDPRMTMLVGENGSGKSTLVEAIAIAAGFNPEGGTRNFTFSTRDSHSQLHEAIRLVRGSRRPRTEFFLRAESFFNVATAIDGYGDLVHAYGGSSLHEQSHGESFLALVLNRFGPEGLYLLDEPEAALSLRGQLALIRRMHELANEGSQFVVATHSPILMGFPGAMLYELSDAGIGAVGYEESDQVTLTRAFLDGRDQFLRHLLAD